jgi:hypothetical protein
MNVRLPVTACKQKLGTLWIACGGILFFVVFLQSILGKYDAAAQDAWSWFLPHIMPTMSLIVGSLALGTREAQKVDAFIYKLAFWLSAFYLCMLALTIFLPPLVADDPLPAMKSANLWLAPLQGLVSAAIGAFFIKKSP